jgi:hypothetical protein
MIREKGWHHAEAVMGAPGFLQGRLDIGALLPEGGGEQQAAAARTLCGQNAMANVLLKQRPAMATFNSMVGELVALLLKLPSKAWLACKMRIVLKDDAKIKYIEALENYKPSEEQLRHHESQTFARGRGVKLSHEGLAEKLGRQWSREKVGRFFNGNPKYPVTEGEAKAICELLGIDYDINDYNIKNKGKAGAAPAHPSGQESVPSGKRLDVHEGRKDNDVDPKLSVPDTQQPCNPVALRAAASDGSIPDPFASSDFHLKVSVEEDAAAKLQLPTQPRKDAASLSCCMRFSLYQRNDVVPLAGIDGVLENSFCLADDDPSPLIAKIKQLLPKALVACENQLGNAATPLRLHLHLALPVTWLSGQLPEEILEQLSRQVFFGCSRREELDESAVTQLRSQAIEVNRKLHSGSSLSSLNWATVCHHAGQPIPAYLFPHANQVLHRNADILDSEADHLELAGLDALLAAEKGLLFPDPVNDAGGGSWQVTLDQRWQRLVELGLPLVFWWRGAGTLAKSAGLDRLGAVLMGSWSKFCDDLHLLKRKVNPTDHENLAKKNLLAYLGIFYEEPLRRQKPAPFHHPLHPAP